MQRASIVFGLLILVAGSAFQALMAWWTQPFEGQPQVVLEVEQGASLASVAADLESAGALKNAQLWRQVARFRGQASQIKQGEYLITNNLAPRDILHRLVAGEAINYAVTLPEGIRLSQALTMLADAKYLKQTLVGGNDPKLLSLIKPQTHTEGMFFPDTYQYRKGNTDLSILKRAHGRLLRLLDAEWQGRADGLPLKSPYDALVLASIIEKETGQPQERDKIAGIFIRRLDRGMRLQADPTVIYGLGEAFDGNLRRSHLDDATNPYNSYRHKGLPPSPIGLAGRAAIHAAVHPSAGSELYFVARGDGSHVFSATIEQHNQAVRDYQLRKNKNYRSTPNAGN